METAMSERLCVADCGRPTRDILCSACTSRLVMDLRDLVDGGRDQRGHREPGLLAELDITVSRQHVLAGARVGVRSPSAGRPVPYHEAAAELRYVVDNTVTTWARDVAERNPHLLPPSGSTSSAAAWLAGLPGVLALHPAAGELHDELTHVVARVRVMIDRGRDRVYLGPCGAELDGGVCGDDLYALPEFVVVRCSTCGAEFDTERRREWLLDVVQDQLATAAEISRALPTLLARPVTSAMIRGYAHRGRLLARPADVDGRPRYRVGDVIEVVTRDVTPCG